MEELQVLMDEYGNKVVVIADIIYKSRQNVEWDEIEVYLEKYIGSIVKIVSTQDMIYIGKKFPGEYTGSRYTRSLKGARAKAKANAVQGIWKLLEIASNRVFNANKKQKHSSDASKGWYYYTTRFALPIYKNSEKTDEYNIYKVCLLINCASNGRMYLYDLVDIKKEASKPLKTKI